LNYLNKSLIYHHIKPFVRVFVSLAMNDFALVPGYFCFLASGIGVLALNFYGALPLLYWTGRSDMPISEKDSGMANWLPNSMGSGRIDRNWN
jgi:hypothetical protein